MRTIRGRKHIVITGKPYITYGANQQARTHSARWLTVPAEMTTDDDSFIYLLLRLIVLCSNNWCCTISTYFGTC